MIHGFYRVPLVPWRRAVGSDHGVHGDHGRIREGGASMGKPGLEQAHPGAPLGVPLFHIYYLVIFGPKTLRVEPVEPD